MAKELNKEVIEKVLECVRDMADEMGPASLEDHMEWIVGCLEQLLDKTAPCQTGEMQEDGTGENAGNAAGDEDDSGDDSASIDEEDLDHDELILGNATDLIVALSKCLQDSFLPYLQRLGPKLVKYLGDEHGKSDKIMVIGCLGETFNQVPSSMATYFNDYIQVLMKHSQTSDGSLNRNVAYSFAICADKASPEQFLPHMQAVMQAIRSMYQASAEQDAKDNCLAGFVRILEKYHDQLPEDERNTLFEQIMTSLPLQGDPSENQTMLKFIMNINASQPQKVLPHMERIVLTCLKLLTDSRCKRDLDESFKVLTAKFIKNVVMNCGRDDVIQKLQQYEAQMTEFERADLTRYMQLAA